MGANVIQYRYSGVDESIPGVADGSQDIVFADPPYNIGVRYEDDPTRDRLDHLSYVQWVQGVIFSGARALRPGGTFWWLCPAAHVDFLPRILETFVGPRKYMIVKNETFAQYQQKTLTEDYRLLFCHQKVRGPLTFNPDAIRIPSKRQEVYGDKRADTRGRVPGQVWTIRRLQGTSNDRVDWHKAQLPPELLSRIVLGWSNPGDKVLDLFAGSGNMGVVCQRAGRDCTLIDGSPTYCQKIKERLKL